MKLKEGVILQEIDGQHIAIDCSGKNSFHGMLKMNRSAAFVLECLHRETDLDGVVAKLTEKYDVEADKARADVRKTLAALREAGLLIE